MELKAYYRLVIHKIIPPSKIQNCFDFFLKQSKIFLQQKCFEDTCIMSNDIAVKEMNKNHIKIEGTNE